MSGKKLVIAAAGTGGHVMPGLAVAREMRRRGWDIEWIGTQTGMEGGLGGRDDIVFHGLDFRGMRGRGLSGLVSGAIKLVKSPHAAKKLFAQMRPDVLFTTGGYIAGFLLLCPIYGLLCRNKAGLWAKALALFLGLLACYAFGTLWFVKVYGDTKGPITLLAALSKCVFPFILPDLAKLALALWAGKRLEKYRQ